MLLLTDWFPPAYQAGGPIRSCANLAEALAEDITVYVLTSNQDLGGAPLSVAADEWQVYQDNIRVMYCSAGRPDRFLLRRIILEKQIDCLYLNSMFSPRFTLLPLLLSRYGKVSVRVVLAPRGMLKDSALAFKRAKKQSFLLIARLLGWYRKVHFQATDAEEVRAIRRFFGDQATVTQLSNLPAPVAAYRPKPKGIPHFIFVGRIHPIKGLALAIEAFQSITRPAVFTIVGNVEDEDYFQQCRQLTEQLPDPIQVHWRGGLPHAEIQKLLQQHHFFLLPTHGENFGHAIFEAFATGTPVLISDQTPWRDLENKKIGWDLPLAEPGAWVAAIRQAMAMEQAEYTQWSRAAYDFAQAYFAEQDLVERYVALFQG